MTIHPSVAQSWPEIFRRLQLYGLAAVLVASSGCTSLAVSATSQVSSIVPWAESDRTAPVDEILALWQPGEGRDVNGLPTRGFAGQIFFFTSGSKEPIAIDGDISVLVFDDQGTIEEQQKPIHEFKFNGGVWKSFRQETNLGPAYQLFVPYTREGAHRASCSLRIRYTEPSGQMVLSEAADVILNGSTPETIEENATIRPSLGRQPSRMTAETIEMPKHVKDSLFPAPRSRRSEIARAGFDGPQSGMRDREVSYAVPDQPKIQHASYSLSSVRKQQAEVTPSSHVTTPEKLQPSKQATNSGVSHGSVYKIPLD